MKRLVGVTLLAVLISTGCQEAPERPDIATAVTGAPGGATPSAAAKYDRLAEMLQWARCMREQGVDMPDPSGGDVKGWPPELGGKGSALEQRIVEAQFAWQRHERFLSDDGVEGPMTTEEFQAWRACENLRRAANEIVRRSRPQ